MLRLTRLFTAHRHRTTLATLSAFSLFAIFVTPALALITGGTGNDPVRDPGWPAGAAAVFNQSTRVAHWEGPPFGGGQSHGEYRGTTQEFNVALENFAKIDAKSKRLKVHDGIGRSFWLNMNN